MGRFASTVGLYEELRPPYPPAFFRNVAEQLPLSRQHALIDLGTGPGLLALGFALYVGRVVGVDPEPGMLAAAREAAARTSVDLTLIEGKVETLPPDIGAFDVITIGRALHWMDRETTLARFETLLASDGRILICGSVTSPENPWLEEYNAARRAWSAPKLWAESGTGNPSRRDPSPFFKDSAFHLAELIRTGSSHTVSVRDLARRVLTFSSSSPEVLGERVDAMLADVEQRLLPFSRDGVITEAIVALAQVVKRVNAADLTAASVVQIRPHRINDDGGGGDDGGAGGGSDGGDDDDGDIARAARAPCHFPRPPAHPSPAAARRR
jgi:SAM-dependent methyltransferase